MRIDIWSELASKPLRLFRNKRYQKFCSLVGELSPFYSEISSEMRWTSSLLRLTEELQIAIEAQKNDDMIKKTLIKMQNFNDLPSTVQSCIDELTTVTESKKILNVCSVNDYKEKIKLANREIKYQILCDQVNQIHKKVDEYVPISWRGNILANMLHFFIEKVLDNYFEGYFAKYNLFHYNVYKSQRIININQILFFQSDGKRVIIYTKRGQDTFYGKLSDCIKQPCMKHFVFIHQSYLINTFYIDEIRNGKVYIDKWELPISRKYSYNVKMRI